MNNTIVIMAACVLGSYLLGSLSSAILICHLFRLPDPRKSGSHNPGATNVLRIGGKLPAALTLLGDLLKGFLPVWEPFIGVVTSPGLSVLSFSRP